jgi:hypothetical protein
VLNPSGLLLDDSCDVQVVSDTSRQSRSGRNLKMTKVELEASNSVKHAVQSFTTIKITEILD